MIINGKYVVCYQIISFKNFFACAAKLLSNNKFFICEVSKRNNNIKDLIGLFNQKNLIFCGFNNIHYDNPVVNYILKAEDYILNSYSLCTSNIYNISDIIINDKDDWGDLKYAKEFYSFDLMTMLFSKKRRAGLKALQITSGYDNIIDFNADNNDNLPEYRFDEAIDYIKNNVCSIEHIIHKCHEKIKLRVDIQKEFGINVLSQDDVSAGSEMLKSEYIHRTGKSWKEINNSKSPCNEIFINNIILPTVKFTTEPFIYFFDKIRIKTIYLDKKEKVEMFNIPGIDSPISCGLGGIHSINESEKIEPKEGWSLYQSDVDSMYPSIGGRYKLVPPHIDSIFSDIYNEILDERLQIKAKQNKTEEDISRNKMLKHALTGACGNYNNQTSWLYSPKTFYQIVMNSQMFIMMLIERLIQSGCIIKQVNTDGIIYLAKNDVNINSIISKWQKDTKLSLSTNKLERVYQYDVNNYIAIECGFSITRDKNLIKKVGIFDDAVELGGGMTPKIISIALCNNLINGTPIESTLKEDRDITHFITYQNVGKEFKVKYGYNNVQRVNRFYYSTNGFSLIKYKGKDETLIGNNVTIVNNLNDIKEFPDNVNYTYYGAVCYQYVELFNKVQLSLFD